MNRQQAIGNAKDTRGKSQRISNFTIEIASFQFIIMLGFITNQKLSLRKEKK